MKTESKKPAKQDEKPISKKKLLNELSITKLKKIAKKLDIDPDDDSRIFVVDKDEYIEVLSSSRKVTVEKIQEILGL